MQNVNITLSVLLDNAVYEYEKATEEIIQKYGLSPDMAEIAMEKALFNMKSKKLTLYATAMHDMARKNSEEVTE